MIARSLLFAAATLLLACVGCRKASVEAYRVPKEKDPESPFATSGTAASAPAGAPMAAGGTGMASTPVATAEGPALTWSTPAQWKEKAASAMRKGTYTVPGNGGEAELSITAFGGDVGGELANVNRWRGQVQQPPIGEAELATQLTRSEHDGLQFAVADIGGGNGQRILGAIVPYAGATWFFKVSGPDAVVEGAKPDFLAFIQTVKPAAGANQ